MLDKPETALARWRGTWRGTMPKQQREMEMESYDLVEVSQKNLDFILDNSCEDAPWIDLPGRAFEFLREGIEAGLEWRIHNDVLVAYTIPKTKGGRQRQERARRDMEWSANLRLYPSGIMLFGEAEVGAWRNGELYRDPETPGKDKLMEELMDVFWQDIPPLAWRRLGEVLVKREFDNIQYFDGEKRSVAQDYLDFGKAWRVLSSVGKLQPQSRMDWNKIANPLPEDLAKKPKPK